MHPRTTSNTRTSSVQPSDLRQALACSSSRTICSIWQRLLVLDKPRAPAEDELVASELGETLQLGKLSQCRGACVEQRFAAGIAMSTPTRENARRKDYKPAQEGQAPPAGRRRSGEGNSRNERPPSED
jgi:hypothetical protein